MRKSGRGFKRTRTPKDPAIAELAVALLLYGVAKLLQPKNTSTKK